MRTHPALYLLTTLVALATGVALLSAAFTIGAPRPADPRSVATQTVIRAFYEALTETIRTGDVTAVEAVVADNFVSRGSTSTVAPGREGLTRYLTALHRTAPDVEITVEQVVTAGDRAIVFLAVQGGEDGNFLGLPVAGGPPPWGTVDAIRVIGQRVVEHWSGASSLALREPLGRTEIVPPPSGMQTPILARLTLPPGGVATAPRATRSHALQVERGAITIAASRLARTHDNPMGSITLTAGGLLALADERTTTLRNTGQTTASLLMTTFLPAGDIYLPETNLDPGEVNSGLSATDWVLTGGAQVSLLAGGLVTRLPSERLVVAAGQVTLAPGAWLPLAEATGPILLAVDRGTVRFRTGAEKAWIRHSGWDWNGSLAKGSLAAGDGAQLRAGTLIAFDNPGTEAAVITIVAILPADGSTGVVWSGAR